MSEIDAWPFICMVAGPSLLWVAMMTFRSMYKSEISEAAFIAGWVFVVMPVAVVGLLLSAIGWLAWVFIIAYLAGW